MNIYDPLQVQNFIAPILGYEPSLMPIGNHHLKRNAVYKIWEKSDHQPLILKLYTKPLRAVREKICLSLLKDTDLPTPEMVASGETKGLHWLVESFVPGDAFFKKEVALSRAEINKLYQDFGKVLRTLHQVKRFSQFGAFENQAFYVPFSQYVDSFLKRILSIEEVIVTHRSKDYKLLLRAIYVLKKNLSLLSQVEEGVLCHNDYDGRNILIAPKKGEICVSGLIDFEQSMPWDRDFDFISFYVKVFRYEEALAQAFFQGYGLSKEDFSAFMQKKSYYLLYQGTTIGSFAEKTAPDYYDLGIQLVQEHLPHFEKIRP